MFDFKRRITQNRLFLLKYLRLVVHHHTRQFIEVCLLLLDKSAHHSMPQHKDFVRDFHGLVQFMSDDDNGAVILL